MTPELWVTLGVAALAAIGSIGAAGMALLNHGKLDRLEVSINGRLTQLLKANEQAARAEGIVAGSVDRLTVTEIIAKAMTDAIAMSPPGSGPQISSEYDAAINKDTNTRVRDIQGDAAAVAAALIVKNAATIAAALVVKTAEDAANLARHDQIED